MRSGRRASQQGASHEDASKPAVAIDVTPLIGMQTGVGVAVGHLVRALGARGVPLVPYALSRRARRHAPALAPGTRFPPVPARLLLRSWATHNLPRLDRWLDAAEVVHATNFLAPPSRAPVVVTVHDCAFVRDPALTTERIAAYVPVLRRAIAAGASVHTPSRAVAADVEALFEPGLDAAGRIHVIPWGPPDAAPPDQTAPATRALLDRGPFVLAIGRLEARKNLTALVEAFGPVGARHDDLHLVIVGPDGPDRPRVDTAIDRLGPATRARVHLAGPLGDGAKAALLEAASLVVYPSLDEGFGFPLLEAMQARTPIVASNAGAIPEVAGDAARLVDGTDHSALAGAIVEVLEDAALADRLVDSGTRRRAMFDWATTASAFEALYGDLLEQRGRRRA